MATHAYKEVARLHAYRKYDQVHRFAVSRIAAGADPGTEINSLRSAYRRIHEASAYRIHEAKK